MHIILKQRNNLKKNLILKMENFQEKEHLVKLENVKVNQIFQKLKLFNKLKVTIINIQFNITINGIDKKNNKLIYNF